MRWLVPSGTWSTGLTRLMLSLAAVVPGGALVALVALGWTNRAPIPAVVGAALVALGAWMALRRVRSAS